MNKTATAAEYLAKHGLDAAPSEWVVGEIGRIADMIANGKGDAADTEWRRDMIAALTDVLVQRAQS